MSMHQFYLTRAADAEREAAAATLANVRERHLSSAATWTSLAARARRVDRLTAANLAAKRLGAATAAPMALSL
jgi:hypothetical protein